MRRCNHVFSLQVMAFAINGVVRGYHIYKDIWSAKIDSELPCCPESGNREDRYAVAVMNGTHVVGHVPRKISFICHLFLRHSGMMVCKITGPRQYSTDLHQGGLEVPCQYQFYSDNEERLKKVKGLIEKALYTTKAVIIDAKHFQKMEFTESTTSSSRSAKDNHDVTVVDADKTESAKDKTENPVKRRNIDASRNGKKEWLRVSGIKLTEIPS